MSANLPPAYFEADRKFRGAKSVPEKIAALQEMTSATPKHKGTDHLRAELRSRMARLMADLAKPKTTGSGPQPFSLGKEGAGQAILIGLPNSGKSQLLASLTGAAAKVAAYPFTTQVPQPGMVRYQNVGIQLVDTPAINDQDMQTRLFSLLRNTDLLVAVADLSVDAVRQMEELLAELDRWGYRLLGPGEEPDQHGSRVEKPALLVGSKADAPGGLDQWGRLEAAFASRLDTTMVSAWEDVGLDDLSEGMFLALGLVRVYTKAPGQAASYESPIVLTRGSNVQDAAASLHKDWGRKLKYSLLWGSGKFDGQRVGRDYVVSDGDVLEFHL
ncbi:MAG: 50S ribosome-binding GTPase [Dehalococcoidia bacterium]|nr:50S ribosome-binding GTPase [Dehalococcoidia bacterium]